MIALHCSSSHGGQWAALAEDLAGRFAVCAPDLHGYGKSPALPSDNQPYFVHDVAAVAALIDESDGPVHLVGHSLGGTVALHTALASPDRIASLTLYEPVQFSILEEMADPSVREYHQIASDVGTLVRFDRLEEASKRFVEFWSGLGAFEAMPEHIQRHVVETISRVRDEWAGVSRFAPGQLRRGDLARLTMPVTVLRGEKTREAARAITEALASALPQVTLHEIAGVGHMGPVTHPERINPFVVSALEPFAAPR